MQIQQFVRNSWLWGLLLLTTQASAQNNDSLVVFDDDPELAAFDSALVATYLNHFCFSADTLLLNVNCYKPDSVPEFSKEVYKTRLDLLDAGTPMALAYNDDVEKFINLYSIRRAEMTSRVIALSEYYFPMFEQVFDKYDIPYEMRYLAVVESALNPRARSRVGAVGLWQFMPATGKMYGLRITSYVDERMDPWKSTDAACRYLRDLYERYNDWDLALAAYNSGPGNVNKAIRRSGGKKDYWSIRPYLPKETRSYVPAFIAVNYVFEHAADHNIYPCVPTFSFFEIDTLMIQQTLKFDQITAFTQTGTEVLEFLNPTYKQNVIPGDGRRYTLSLPVDAIGLFLTNEDSIYTHNKDVKQDYAAEEEFVIYYVRSGDVLGKIAQNHGVSVSSIKAWNNLRSNMIHPGQKLTIYTSGTKKTSYEPPKPEKPKLETDGVYKYHIVQEGDTLWDIAKLYDGITVDHLKALNSGIEDRLQLGQKIKIKKIS